MNPNWAEENLQTIRTLMERSAVYRRALAPIMLLAGTLGVVATAIGLSCHLDSIQAFGEIWLATAAIAVVGALLIARRQALKDKEVFWSPPTRRVIQALVPPLLAGLLMGAFPILLLKAAKHMDMMSAFAWILFYGCALHAAGIFLPRGMKLFGWVFILSGCYLFYAISLGWLNPDFSAHWVMGFFFGGLHLIYGTYLYLTERKNPIA